MTYIVPEIALATRGDIVGILDLQEQNLLGRGGLLSVRLPGAFIEAALDDLPQIVARRDGKIVAYLLAGSRSVHAQTPIIKAMFHAYSGSHDAYIYGPICVAESERGHWVKLRWISPEMALAAGPAAEFLMLGSPLNRRI